MSTSPNIPALTSDPPPFNAAVSPAMTSEVLDDESPWDEVQEDAPAWLISVLFHAVIVILLGLLSVGADQHMGDPLALDVLATYSPDPDRLDVSLGADMDEVEPEQLVDEFQVLPTASTVSSLASESVSLTGAVADLESNWQKMFPSGNADDSVMASAVRGLAGEGEGSGSGNGRSGEGSAIMDRTSFFGLAGEGGKFVYVFDRSDSMNAVLTRYSEGTIVGTIVPLEAAKRELKRSLSTLSNASEFQIVFYNGTVESIGSGHYEGTMFRATLQNKELAYDYIDETPGQGSTDHRIALDAAAGLEPDVIFLLTDAQRHDDLSPETVARIIKYCKLHHIVINVVHLSDRPRADSTMIIMAEGTGGKHVFLDLKRYADTVDVVDFIKAF